ncbi:MAG: ABC transporter permease [Clostridia bacterium]|nr:ABC transporter permease [Clostridia bacterium]
MEATPLEQMKATLTALSAQMDPQTAAYIAQLDDDGVKAYYRTMVEQEETKKFAVEKKAEYSEKAAADIVAEMVSVQASLTDEQRMTLYKAAEFIQYVNKLDENGKANAYVDILVADQMAALVEQINNMSHEDLVAFIENLLQSGSLEVPGDYQQYVNQLLEKDEKSLKETCIGLIKSDVMQTKETTRAEILQGLADKGLSSPVIMAQALSSSISTYTIDQFVNYYDNVLAFSETNYEDILVTLGKLDLDSPATINIYASSFENKDIIEAAIADYNEGKDELQRIVYTDYVGLMMSSVTTIINAITYVLIAFVAISLIVSSIMIGVITLISVQERTKEIGILRAIGASKRNVSSMFNAETVIIGFTAGLLGVLITYLLCIPINIILYALTDIPNLKAILPTEAAVILVIISVVLTLFAGIIPSRSAAKKDPVVALRTE